MKPPLSLPLRSRNPVVWILVLAALGLLVHAAQAARPVNVSQSLKEGQTLAGQVAWSASVNGPKNDVDNVAFSIDGVVRSTDVTNPFAYGSNGILDTTTLSNGSHTFTVVATTKSGTAASTVTAVVQNGSTPPPPQPPAPFTVSQSLSSSQTVSGTIGWSATPGGVATSDVAGVDFLVDSTKVTTDTVAPYGDAPGFFDTKTVSNGSHTFSVKATAKDGRTATATATMTVDNSTTTPPPSSTPQPSFPIYATFYYPWYPETWTVDGAHVFFHPTLGYYSTTDVATQQAHIREMDYAGLEAAISSWWGPTHYSHTRLKTLMQTTSAMGSKLKWAVYYEMEGYGDPTVDKLAADLTVIRDSLATSPAYLKVNGRFVVFVYGADDTTCEVADRWKQANQRIANAAYVQLKVFYGYRNCASQPDAWHQYGPSTASDEQAGQSITISPGFWRANESSPRLARDPARWRSNVATMVASTAPWKLVATYNEWTEGTAIESAADWGSASGHGTYVDALKNAIVGP